MLRRRGLAVAAGCVVASVFVLAAAAAPGDRDPTFGVDGIVRPSVGATMLYALAVQADGKILAAAGGSDVKLVRLQTDGDPDPAFGDGGVVRTDLGGSDTPYAIAVQ